eukprot:COSAG02_NODE_1242_length_13682_cov_1219.312523_8_plen_303_part_00
MQRRATVGSAGVIHSCAQWKASSNVVATFGRRDIPGGLPSGPSNSSGVAAVPPLPDVELVYFDIHARGELVRLCYAAHAASGGQDSFIDTRLPFVSFYQTRSVLPRVLQHCNPTDVLMLWLSGCGRSLGPLQFMDSDANQKLCDEVHRPAAPFAFFPYINLRDPMTGQVQQAISGDGVIEGHVAGRLGLLGAGVAEASVCMTVAHAALSPCSPPLTGAGLRGDSMWIVESLQPAATPIGTTLTQLERYIGGITAAAASSSSPYIVGARLTVADLSVFNALDECMLGPRGHQPQAGVEGELRR